MVLLAFATLALQMGAVWLMAAGWQSHGQVTRVPVVRGPLGQLPGLTVIPASTVVTQGELWASVASGSSQMPGAALVRPASSRLMAFDLTTGEPRETGITLSPAPLGLVVIDGQLWCVAETVVYRIENGEAIPRHPRRALMQASRPFEYQGRLAVIDKNKNNQSILLTWNDGEWNEEGLVDVPVPVAANRWLAPDVRVVSQGQTTYVFYTDGSNFFYREGIHLVSNSDPEPVSALEPENIANSLMAVSLKMNSGMSQRMPILPGWKTMPFSLSWASSWEVALINGELWAFQLSGPNSGNSTIQQFRMQGQNWITAKEPFPPEMLGFGVAGGSSGYLVTDDLRLFSLQGATFQRITTGYPITERFRTVLTVVERLIGYLLVNGLLILVAEWLMRTYRTPEYLYGKQIVIQAPLLRRAFARGIDLLLTVFPSLFWFSMVMDADVRNRLQQQSAFSGIQVPLALFTFSIFGMWMGGILVCSFMEGFWGFTPGKWLCGIRTRRTTLRPCGMLRAFARELLVFADSVFFLTWLPGVLLIAFTPHRQRLGDLTADTVVILDPHDGRIGNWSWPGQASSRSEYEP